MKKELVLKIYQKESMRTYLKEALVLDKIEELSKMEKIEGFPKVISKIQGPYSSEILMEALGPNLRKLMQSSPTS